MSMTSLQYRKQFLWEKVWIAPPFQTLILPRE